MKGYKEVYVYIMEYFNNKSYFNDFKVNKTLKGLKINSNNYDIYVENDEYMGWHCYGNVQNITFAEIIENDLELFFDTLNKQYYFNGNCVEI